MALILYAATYDGSALVEVVDGAPRQMIGLIRGLDDSWTTRGSDDIIPGTSGRNPRDRKRDRLTIELAGELLGVGDTDAEQRADIRLAWEDLRALFDVERDPADLVVDLEDGGTATIECRPVNIVAGQPDLANVRKVSIELEAVGDDWLIDLGGS